MSHDFGFSTTNAEVCGALADRIIGRTIVITGCSVGGLGFETARAIAQHSPKLLILAGRSMPNLKAAEKELHAQVPSLRTRLLELDLSSQKQVRKAAAEVDGWQDMPEIDVVINNAALADVPYTLSPEGIEMTFATNHIGHFLFTNLIMGKVLKAGPGARVVNVSSMGHRRSNIRWEDVNFTDGKAYAGLEAYGQSKTANILYSVALAERLESRDIQSFSLHPGTVVTNLLRAMTKESLADREWTDENGDWTKGILANDLKTFAQGASTTLVAAFDPSIAGRTGAFLCDCKVNEERVQAYAVDRGNAERLWKLSEVLVGQKFDV